MQCVTTSPIFHEPVYLIEITHYLFVGYEDNRQCKARPADCDVQCYVPTTNGGFSEKNITETDRSSGNFRLHIFDGI